MNRIDRLQAILIQLQTKKIVRAKEIADRFNISLRTVYRDIRALEDGGIPIGAEAGIGYFLDESYSLPPIMFTTNEALSLLLAGKLIPHLSDKKVNQSFQAALYKIKSVLKTDDKESVQKLEHAIRVYSGLKEQIQKDSLFLQEIQKALIQSKIIEFQYYSQYNQQCTQRLAEPIALIFYSMNWHLIAWCKLRNAYRDFRLDRIQGLTVSDQVYERKLDKAFEDYLTCQKDQHDYFEIKLKVTQPLVQFINESKYWYGFISEEPQGNDVCMTFLNPDLYGFARWVITMGADVDIVEPFELYKILKSLIQNLYPKYL